MYGIKKIVKLLFADSYLLNADIFIIFVNFDFYMTLYENSCYF
jgi:hypothetical protein